MTSMTEPLFIIFDSLLAMPLTVSLLITGLSKEQLSHRNSPDEFSALENLCHLRDIEVEGYSQRIRKIVKENQPSLPDIDGGRLAIERDYNHQNANEALEQFTRARVSNVEILRGLSGTEMSREGILEGVGRVNLEKLVQMMREHDEGHVSELKIIRRRIDRETSD